MKQLRIVLILEDDIARAKVLVSLVQRVFSKACVKMAYTLAQAREVLMGIEPDICGVALVNVGDDTADGIQFVEEISQRLFNFMPVVISKFEDEGYLLEALRAGARGYMLKDEEEGAMEHALRQMLKGYAAVSPKLVSSMIGFIKDNREAGGDAGGDEVKLSSRETEVLALLGRGMRVGSVARELGLSEYTVGDYVKAIYKKLKIRTRAEAAVEAVRRGLVK